MEPILVEATQLNVALLETDEEEYDAIALKVVAALKKLRIPDLNQLQQV